MKSNHQPAPVLLIVRDGWGVSPNGRSRAVAEGNATLLANTPVHDRLLADFPSTLIGAAEEYVGLPHGQMGNSEVGHLSLGAGRIVPQDFTRITAAVEDRSFFETPALRDVFQKTVENRGRLHLMGLCSDGGVHSHIDHLFALLEMAAKYDLQKVLLHCFTDGRDTPPHSGIHFLSSIAARTATLGVGEIASVCGRYYAMDRDSRWDRTKKAYDVIVRAQGERKADPIEALRESYEAGITDEFIIPFVVAGPHQEHYSAVRDTDSIVFFNFRPDRARQLARAITHPGFSEFPTQPVKAEFLCMTQYDKNFGLPVAFPPARPLHTLSAILSAQGLAQLRISETEKYAHVTYFFGGGVEVPAAGEDRCLIPSPHVSTYDKQPEMSAWEMTDELLSRLHKNRYPFTLVNYANPDMLGHTGNIPATVKALETVDTCIGRLLEAIENLGGTAFVTADHGNAEKMLDENGQSFTAHTTNLVHFMHFNRYATGLRAGGSLADIAPTILDVMGFPKASEMTGRSLIEPIQQFGKKD
jgi:2,3-bisphosphoglycerate-independent phosphoglycerate mutase